MKEETARAVLAQVYGSEIADQEVQRASRRCECLRGIQAMHGSLQELGLSRTAVLEMADSCAGRKERGCIEYFI